MGVPLTANRNPQWSVNAAELEDRSSPGFNVFQMSFRSSGKGSQNLFAEKTQGKHSDTQAHHTEDNFFSLSPCLLL